MLDVDLIITTKNRINQLLYTIKHAISVLELKEGQIFIIDDASDDDTFETIKVAYPNVSIYRNETSKGLIANRNSLMKMTSRKFIFSLDDDSHIRSKEDLLEAIQLLLSSQHYGALSFNPFEQIDAPPSKATLSQEIINIKSFIGCGHLIKRDVFNEIGEYYEPFEFYCEEVDFCIRAFKKGYSTVMKKNLVVHHRIDWSIRQRQTEDDLEKGVYGAIWRSQLGFSNHLFVDYIYFPLFLNLFLVVKHTLLRFINFYIKKNDKKGFYLGFKRFMFMIRQNKRTVNKLDWSESLAYLKQPNF
jgi:GT2 family glycosyltransferase